MLKLFGRKKAADPRSTLREAIGEQKLPSFPAVILTALERVRDEDATTDSVAEIVSSDPGMSVRLLSTVNSASFAVKHPVKNLHHAVALLGRSELESILISMAVREVLPRRKARGFEAGRFWSAAARRAVTARALADRIDPSTSSESFTAALLQDMALPVLADCLGEGYGQQLECWHSGPTELVDIERESYGWDHATVAHGMAVEWGFPNRLAEAIAAHHGTAVEDATGLAAVNLVAGIREVDEQAGVEQLVETTHRLFAVAKDETVGIVARCADEAREIARLFA